MLRNNRTSAQINDFKVKTIELTKVRKALMNPVVSNRWSGNDDIHKSGVNAHRSNTKEIKAGE